jgi:hypothetical protein
VVVGAKLFSVNSGDGLEVPIPIETGVRWLDSAVSWSPDGLNLAYTVALGGSEQTELRVYNAATTETQTLAFGVDPALAVAWTIGCVAGLEAPTCRLGYKTSDPLPVGHELRPHLLIPAWADELRPTYLKHPMQQLVALTPLSGEQQVWPIPVDKIFALRWTADNSLLYSQPRNYFHRAPDYSPAYQISPGSQLANMSPDGRYTVYYEPFTQKECQAERPKGGCWYLGVWLAENEKSGPPRQLIYSRELTQAGEGRLNADPFWSPYGDAFVLFREGTLVHYSLKYREAAVWSTSLHGQLTSAPMFSPNEEAVAFVVHQEEASSQYHLLMINPQFKPLEQIIEARQGLRVLAWLPPGLQ